MLESSEDLYPLKDLQSRCFQGVRSVLIGTQISDTGTYARLLQYFTVSFDENSLSRASWRTSNRFSYSIAEFLKTFETIYI